MSAQPPDGIITWERGWWHPVFAEKNFGIALERAGLSFDEAMAVLNMSKQDVERFGRLRDDWEATEMAFAAAERLERLTAHDRMRLAAFRADSEQKPSAPTPSTDQATA